MSKPLRAALVGAAIAALATLPGLGVGTLWDNSETAYGEVAREILLTGDWIVMHSNGHPWFVQPPLYFWIAAIFAKLFGVTSFALRLPSALATIAMGGMTGYAVARQRGTRAGIYAGVILSTCLMQAIMGRLAIMDALLDLAVSLSIFWWFRALETGRDRYAVYGWIAAGFGFLAKGPVAPVAALLVIVPYYLWNRRMERTYAWSPRAWIAGLAGFVLIVAPWLVLLGMRTGLGSIVTLIGHYTIGRYTGVIENQAGPIWYYIPVVILGFFPWIAFLPVAAAFAVQRLRANSVDANLARLLRLAVVWAVVPFLFFSFARTKLPNYIALEFPAFALLLALYFDDVARRGSSRAATISAGAVPVTVALVAIGVALFARDNRLTNDTLALVPDLLVMGGAIVAGSILTTVMLALRRGSMFGLYALAAAMLVAVDVLAIFAVPQTERFKPIPKLAAVIDRLRRPGDAVAIEHLAGGNALLFYTAPPVYALSPHDGNGAHHVAPRSIICTARRVFVVAPAGPLPTYGREVRFITRAGKAALVLYHGPACTS
ncbi:MAG: ArnT family glycosyltransferase [Vulcanimicrobiaceae bacterium]